jgi:hypothetical protein
MKLDKARKELKITALISISAGILCFFGLGCFLFLLHGNWHKFSSVSGDKHVQAVIDYLFLAIKECLFGGLPGFGLILIGVGNSILRYLKMENESSNNKT